MKVKGSELSPADQRHVLSAYVHRYTGDHTPAWLTQELKDGGHYALQFASDREWLENTYFEVTKSGNLDKRAFFCESHPTWPNNPELRK